VEHRGILDVAQPVTGCWRAAVPAAVGLLLWFGAAAPAGPQSHNYQTLADIVRDRVAIARALVEPIARCVQRHDTGYTAFHGCIDWHSSVHGTLGLVIYRKLTGARDQDALIERQLTDANVKAERTMLRDRPRFEMPYGRAWFLRLAIEYESQFHSGRLRDIADQLAASLRAFIEPQRSDLMEGAYDSISWALINMLDYAQATGNAALRNFATAYARESLLRAGPRCSYRLEQAEFMSICLQRTWLAAKVLSSAEFENWQQRFLTDPGLPAPVTRPTSAHHYGLNFSRSWALASLYRATGRAEYGASFAAHFGAGFGDRKNWDGDYRVVGHWVAQFGMMALLLAGDGAPPARGR
jgi:hypothetical protein